MRRWPRDINYWTIEPGEEGELADLSDELPAEVRRLLAEGKTVTVAWGPYESMDRLAAVIRDGPR